MCRLGPFLQRRIFVLFPLLMLLGSGVFAQSSPKALDRVEILGRLAFGFSPSYVAHSVKTNHISFSITADFLESVKLAGGEGVLIERLSTANLVADLSDSSAPVFHLSKCAELLHQGAVEMAREECRASVEENPKSPWPLLIAAKAIGLSIMKKPHPDSEPTDGTDDSPTDPEMVAARDMFTRAKSLAPDLLNQFPGREGAAGSKNVHSPTAFEAEEYDFVDSNEDFAWRFHGDEDVTTSTAARVAVAVNISSELQRRIQIEPDLASNHARLADAYTQAGDSQNAENELQTAIRLEPDNSELHLLLANVYRSRHDEEDCIAQLRDATRIAPYDDSQRIHLAQALDAFGKTSEAVAEIETAIAVQPEDHVLSDALVDMYLSHKDRKPAIKELRRLLKASVLRFDSEAKFVLTLYSDQKRVADLLDQDKQYDDAIEKYTYLLRFKPTDADLHNDYGVALLAENRVDEAADQFQQTIRLSPNDSTAHHNLGICLVRKNDIDGAIGELRRTIELNPNEPHSQAFLGYSLAQKGELNAAMEQFQKTIKANPQDAEAHGGLGAVRFMLHDVFGAVTELKLALELDPESPMAENELAWIYVTAEESQFRNPTEALALARRAVASTPEPVPAFVDTLAEALLANGKADEALATELQAVKLAPALEPRLAHFREATGAHGVTDR